MSSGTPLAEDGRLVGSLRPSLSLCSLVARLASLALILGSSFGVTGMSASASSSVGYTVSNSQNLPSVY